MNPAVMIALTAPVIFSPSSVKQSDNASLGNRWIVTEDGYIVNMAYIKYLSVNRSYSGTYYLKAHLTSGSSCTVKDGFNSEKQAIEWLKGNAE